MFAYLTPARIHLILVLNICVIVLNYALPHLPLSPFPIVRLLVFSVCLGDTLVEHTPLFAVSLRLPFSLKNGLHKQAVTLLLLYVLYHDLSLEPHHDLCLGPSHDLSHGASRGLSLGPSPDAGPDLVDLSPADTQYWLVWQRLWTAFCRVWRSNRHVLVDCLLGV